MHWSSALFGLLPIGLGIIFLAIGWLGGRHPHRGWQEADGEIVFSLKPTAGGENYRWLDPDGITRDGQSLFRSAFPRHGRPIKVLYDPANASRSIINEFHYRGGTFMVIGWVLCGLSVLVTVALLALSTPWS